MDNEKKIHEQSLALARQLIEKDPSLRDWVVSKFPELAESEDERIRQALIRMVLDRVPFGRMVYDGLTRENALAYLEKQKEQKPAEKQDYSGLNDLERAIHRGFLVAGVENVPVSIIKETAKDCLAQIKPVEWSEEDERMVLFYEADYNNKVGNMPMKDVIEMRMRFKDWLSNRLKFLRPQPQGVFEQAVRAIYEMCHSYRNKGVFTDERACDFMGNVRLKCKDAIECSPILDEPHWKPSEEQMKALEHFVRSVGESGYASPYDANTKALYSLLEQLKKL